MADKKTPERPRKLSDSAAPVSKASCEGYFSTLGQEFGCTLRAVQKAYRAIALQCHPDKAGEDKVLISRFQAASTAYQVLSNEDAHAAYMRMYRIRCHLHQRAHATGQPLAPFYLLQVSKKDGSLFGFEHQRVMTLDLIEGKLQNWKKDEAHKSTPLSHIAEVHSTGPTSFSVAFSEGERLYKLSTSTAAHCELYVSVLRAIASGVALPKDDAHFPPPSIRKGFVEKAGKSGDWARRWLILGSTNILIFREHDCEKMVNAIPLEAGCVVAQGSHSLSSNWTLAAAGRKWSFRNSKPSIAQAWVHAVGDVLKQGPQQAENWLDVSSSLVERRRRPTGPALIRTLEDLQRKVEVEEEQPLLLCDETIEDAAAEAEGARAEEGCADDDEDECGAEPAGTEQAGADQAEAGAAALVDEARVKRAAVEADQAQMESACEGLSAIERLKAERRAARLLREAVEAEAAAAAASPTPPPAEAVGASAAEMAVEVGSDAMNEGVTEAAVETAAETAEVLADAKAVEAQAEATVEAQSEAIRRNQKQVEATVEAQAEATVEVAAEAELSAARVLGAARLSEVESAPSPAAEAIKSEPTSELHETPTPVTEAAAELPAAPNATASEAVARVSMADVAAAVELPAPAAPDAGSVLPAAIRSHKKQSEAIRSNQKDAGSVLPAAPPPSRPLPAVRTNERAGPGSTGGNGVGFAGVASLPAAKSAASRGVCFAEAEEGSSKGASFAVAAAEAASPHIGLGSASGSGLSRSGLSVKSWREQKLADPATALSSGASTVLQLVSTFNSMFQREAPASSAPSGSSTSSGPKRSARRMTFQGLAAPFARQPSAQLAAGDEEGGAADGERAATARSGRTAAAAAAQDVALADASSPAPCPYESFLDEAAELPDADRVLGLARPGKDASMRWRRLAKAKPESAPEKLQRIPSKGGSSKGGSGKLQRLPSTHEKHSPSADADVMARTIAGQLGQNMVSTFL